MICMFTTPFILPPNIQPHHNPLQVQDAHTTEQSSHAVIIAITKTVRKALGRRGIARRGRSVGLSLQGDYEMQAQRSSMLANVALGDSGVET